MRTLRPQRVGRGLSFFGGAVLATVGLFQFFEGLSAVLKDKVYVSTPKYVYQFDLTTWGWIHLILGLLAVGVGIGDLVGQAWGHPDRHLPRRRCRR